MDIAKKLKCTPPLVYNVRSRMAGGSKKKRVKTVGGRHAVDKSGDLEAVLIAVRNAEQQRARMVRALKRIDAIVRKSLA
jgi:hypothetical protein